MATTDDKRKLLKLARQGKLEGDDGLRQKLGELLKCGIVGEELDFNEKPFFRSALWEATWKNHEAIVRLLADKNANIQFADRDGRTPLHEAAYYGHINLVNYFLEKGHPVDVFDKCGQTPLFRAVEAGRDDVVDILVEKKAQTNLLDKDGCTVQHVASFQGMPDVSHWLLYHGSWKNRFSIEDGGPEIAEDHAEEGKEGGEEAPPAEDATPAAGGAAAGGNAAGRPKFSD